MSSHDEGLEHHGSHRRRHRHHRAGHDVAALSVPSAILLGLFLLLLLVSPLPLGANRDWAWSPMVVAISVIAALCAAFGGSRGGFGVTAAERRPMLWLMGAFAVFLAVVLIQMSPLAPATPSAALYAKAKQLLGQAHAAVPALAIDASYYALLKCLGCALFFLVARTLCRDERGARRLMWILLVSAVAVVAYAMYMQVTTHSCYVGSVLKKEGEYKPAMDRCMMSGTFVGPNNYACYLGMAAVSALALLFGRPARHHGHEFDEEGGGGAVWLTGTNLALAAVALLCTGGILISGSRAGFAATVAAMLALGYLLIRGGENFGVSLRRMMLAGVVGLVVIGAIAGGSLLRKTAFSSNNYNRVLIWKLSINAVRESPLLGWGMGSFSEVYALHQPQSMILANDKAHSTPLETLVELGIPGGLAAMLLAGIPWWVCLRGAMRQSRRHRYLAATAFAVAAVPIGHSMVDFSLQIPAIGFMTSAFLGLGWAHSFPQNDQGDEVFTDTA